MIDATAASAGLAASHRRALQRPPVKPRRGDVHTEAGGACAEAPAAPGPGGLGFVQAAAAVGRRRAVRWAAMMLMLLQWLLAPTWANAAAGCATTSVYLTPSTTNFFAPTGSGIFYTGTLTLDATGCIGGGPGPYGIYLSFPFGTTASSVPSLPGLKIQATGALTHTLNTSNCTWNGGYAGSWTNGNVTTGAWDYTFGNTCNLSISVPIAFSKASGTLTGSVGPTAALGTGAVGGGSVQWAGFNTYGGIETAIAGSTTLKFFTPGCTLGVTNTSVTLPTVSKTSLASAGSTAGKKPFTLAINSCSSWSGGTYAVSMDWSFTPLSPTTDVISNTAATPAANVGVQLLDSTGAPIANGSRTLIGTVPTSGGASFSKSFYAQYYAKGAAGSGGVVGVASITLTYQ